MPANLPPDYYAAERRYREASDAREKVQLLREMLAIMPKHKGTEHLQGDLKKRISKLQGLAQKKQATSHTHTLDHITPEGAGQVVLVGTPNSGKSSLISALTHIESPAADYPFSTFKPYVGMMPVEDIQIQLVDLPPVAEQHTEPWVYSIIRLADLVLLTIDGASESPVADFKAIQTMLKEHRIELVARGDARPPGPVAYKSAFLAVTKFDHINGPVTLQRIQSELKSDLWHCAVSILIDDTLDKFKALTFEALQVLRVYTKIPGKKPDLTKPYVLSRGETVEGAARMIHKELAQSMTYARLWKTPDGQGRRVEKQHILEDRDILEIHLR